MGHIHAELMKLYAEDALETDEPWERWELYVDSLQSWEPCASHPGWLADGEYRRKRTPLCQVEGKDVFPGDRLWHVDGTQYTARGIGLVSDEYLDFDGVSVLLSNLTWTEPAKTKTVYQWAFSTTTGWVIGTYLYESAENFRKKVGLTETVEVRRLDYTALEVPA